MTSVNKMSTSSDRETGQYIWMMCFWRLLDLDEYGITYYTKCAMQQSIQLINNLDHNGMERYGNLGMFW